MNGNPLLQWLLLLLGAVTWLVGGNLIVARHYRRRGVRRRRHLPYTSLPWRTFEAREWAMLAGVFALTITFFLLALFVVRPQHEQSSRSDPQVQYPTMVVAVIYFGFLVWHIVLPNHAVRFHHWFYGRAGIDQRRLDAITPNRLRFGALAVLAFTLIPVLITNR